VSTIQGNFLSPEIQAEVRAYVQDPVRGRARKQISLSTASTSSIGSNEEVEELGDSEVMRKEQEDIKPVAVSPEELAEFERGYIDLERAAHLEVEPPPGRGLEHRSEDADLPEEAELQEEQEGKRPRLSLWERDEAAGRVVDVVLSDMSAPWQQTSGFWHRSISDVYRRMMNTSGNTFRDHVRSMVCTFAIFSCA
jgi:21S rRNA (uridine2791-2'-O)-methyltransferase